MKDRLMNQTDDKQREPATGSGTHGATWNDQGDLDGPDSPAGERAAAPAAGQAQGDDPADRLGGGAGADAAIPAGRAISGDMSAGRSEAADDNPPAAGLGGDPGAPGSMGGPPTPADSAAARDRDGGMQERPPGGSSPVPAEEAGERGDGP